MSGFSAIDLSKLPAPDVIQTVEFDALLDEMRAEAVRLMPELAAFIALESEPVSKLLRVCAWFRMLDRLAFNDGAKACFLSHATGADLDNLAAFWGVTRLITQPADDSVEPPIEEQQETDEEFRRRVSLSLEAHTTAGPRGSYIYWSLSASGDVKDVSVASPVPGDVVVTVLSRMGTGAPSNALLNTVQTALNDDEVRPLTDRVTVQAAAIIPFEVEATLTLYPGPDAAEVQASALAALDRFNSAQHRLGRDVTLSGLHAALHQPGVQNVVITKPAADITVGEAEAAFCDASAVSISFGGTDV